MSPERDAVIVLAERLSGSMLERRTESLHGWHLAGNRQISGPCISAGSKRRKHGRRLAWPAAILLCHEDDRSIKEINMHAVVRSYSGAGARQLFDILENQKSDVQATLQKVSGIVSYTLLRTGDGGMSITVCTDKAGVDESLRVARDWIKNNAANVNANPPDVSEGSVIVQFAEQSLVH